MRSVILDAGPIISLTTTNILHILAELSKKATLNITLGVKHEVVERPLETRKYKFEALQVQNLIDKKILNVLTENTITTKAQELQKLANMILSAHGQNIKIVQTGEMETIAAAIMYKADLVVIDERITRTLIENPKGLQNLMERRLHMQLRVNDKALHDFAEQTRHIKIIRSTELATIAYEQGMLDDFIVKIPNPKRELLESILWSIKLNGCSIADDEIDTIIKTEKL